MYSILLPLASLESIPPEYSRDLIFKFSDDLDEAYNFRLKDMGYGNHNAVENIGSTLFYLFYFFILIFILAVFYVYEHYCCIKIRSPNMVKPILISLYLILFEGYLEISISCYLSLHGAVTFNTDDKISYAIAMILPIFMFTLIPSAHFYLLIKSEEDL